MATAELPHGLQPDLAPPSKQKMSLDIKGWLSLGVSSVWVSLLVIWDVVVVVCTSVFPPPEKSLRGKVVLVTGAGRGLGRGLALGFAREGCKLAVVDVNISTASATAADITADGGVAKAYQCDVADADAVRALRLAVTSDLGPVDVLVNNAGIIYGGDLLEDCEDRDIRAVLEVNLLSHFWTMKEFLPGMKDRNSGHIVAVASAAAFASGETGAAYIASKFGVRGLMEVVRMELALRSNNDIHTTTVYPYFINTSADYVARFKIRIPPVSIEETVGATIKGVKKNSASVFVPTSLQLVLQIVWLIPLRSYIRFKELFFFGIIPQRRPVNESSTALKT